MLIAKSITSFKIIRKSIHPSLRVGLVPTMGSLHSGHVSLVNTARKECDVVITSIFVNPIQFGPTEDFARYPRDLETDVKLLQGISEIIFAPSTEDMYPTEPRVIVTVKGMEKTNEGTSRPGFFNGVATVVTKLFNIVQPDTSFFGQKDAQQCIVIKNIIKKFEFSDRPPDY